MIEQVSLIGIMILLIALVGWALSKISSLRKALDKMNIPVYYLDTEYTREDVGQMKTRVEAFLEMLSARVDF